MYSPSSWMTKHIKQRFRHSASWKRIGVEYSEEWILYYNMMLRLWTDADLHKKVCGDSRKIQITECLDLCESEDLYDRAIGMRLLEMALGLTRARYLNRESESMPLRRVLRIILPQLKLGPSCKDPKGVDQLTRRVIPILLGLHVRKRNAVEENMTAEYCEDVLNVIELIKRWREVFNASHKRIFNHRYISPGTWHRSVSLFLADCLSNEKGIELSEKARDLFVSADFDESQYEVSEYY